MFMRTVISLTVFIVSIVLGAIIYQSESHKREMKEDLIELLKVKYGMFNVDEWRRIFSDLIRKKIDELNVQGGNREEMRADIQAFLYRTVGEFEQAFYTARTNSVQGSFETMIAKQLDVFGQIRNYIPTLTEQVLDFMNNPANREKLKTFVIQKLDEYAANNFSEVDYTLHDQVIKKYSYQTREATITGLQQDIDHINNDVWKYILLATIGAFIIYLFFVKDLGNPEYLLIIATCFSLLFFGVLLPMIEIDARISSISLTLLGEKITFTDQVLYYKSKSILEVVKLMFTQGRVDVLFVGVLVLMFSVLFPTAKLICSIVYVFRPSVRQNNIMNFVVFKTGKWSMADVMVVAIFMAYIGFGGIVSDQLRQLEGISNTIDILTTNRSSLQLGFYLFTSFTILSLVVSQKIQAIANGSIGSTVKEM
jgi:hypothetical protein